MALFTSDEAFQMALQLEASGQLFYESVAKATEDAAVADMCRNLAAQEQAHAAKFQAMRDATSKASPARRFTPEATEFVQAMLEGKILLKPRWSRTASGSTANCSPCWMRPTPRRLTGSSRKKSAMSVS